MTFESSLDRVPRHTTPAVNQEIVDFTQRSIERYRNAPHAERERRLRELEEEWDVERAIEANAAVFSLAGLALAVTVDRRWLALPLAVGGFLLQHSLQGWCPPLPVLRRLGFRTPHEIDEERFALGEWPTHLGRS
jgi:hypothetical protein